MVWMKYSKVHVFVRVISLRAHYNCDMMNHTRQLAWTCVYLQVLTRIKGHQDDVNAIAYLDDSNNVLISGSDDREVKVRIVNYWIIFQLIELKEIERTSTLMCW